MDPHLRNLDTWDGHEPVSWDPSPVGPVVGLAASVLISAAAWLLVVGIAAEFLS
jgi:hypothetical protein